MPAGEIVYVTLCHTSNNVVLDRYTFNRFQLSGDLQIIHRPRINTTVVVTGCELSFGGAGRAAIHALHNGADVNSDAASVNADAASVNLTTEEQEAAMLAALVFKRTEMTLK